MIGSMFKLMWGGGGSIREELEEKEERNKKSILHYNS